MVKRPWVTPEEVKAYTDIESVANRSDEKLAFDIARAELYVISYTGNDFSDEDKYREIPVGVKTAIILLAESYAQSAGESTKRLKSETHDDYSYTASDSTESKANVLDLGALLDEYVVGNTGGGVDMRLRRL